MTGGPAIGAAGVSATVDGPGAFEPWPVPVGVVVGVVVPRSVSSPPQVQFHTQFQPERVEAVGAAMHAPVQFHTQVQVSGAPDPLEGAGWAFDEPPPADDPPPPEEVVDVWVVALTPPGALTPLVLADTPGALAPLVLADTPGALTPSADTWTPGALTLVPEVCVGELAGCVLCCVEPEVG